MIPAQKSTGKTAVKFVHPLAGHSHDIDQIAKLIAMRA
jgi:hypothetical protein